MKVDGARFAVEGLRLPASQKVWGLMFSMSLSSEYDTYKTVQAGFRPCISDTRPSNVSICPLLARKRGGRIPLLPFQAFPRSPRKSLARSACSNTSPHLVQRSHLIDCILSISFSKSTAPHNCQRIVDSYSFKYSFDGFVGELTC